MDSERQTAREGISQVGRYRRVKKRGPDTDRV